jgi:DNA-binding NarL/FixJ family response regulator
MDALRLLVDLQKVSALALSFSGCLDPDEISRRTTDRLVQQFDFAFSRIWLVEPDQSALRLVASSGMYTRIDGSFARVPMGAFKVGKIAQNRVPFLSNNLPNESWVKDRDWAIANHLHGFAGYPLLLGDRVLGVLVVFSHHAIEPEFLEVLQTLCTIVAIVLDTALSYQQEQADWRRQQQAWQDEKHRWQQDKQTWPFRNNTLSQPNLVDHPSLADQLVTLLSSTRLSLVGTERSLSLPVVLVFVQAATVFNQLNCAHCRLIYADATVALEAILNQMEDGSRGFKPHLQEIERAVVNLGGSVQAQPSRDRSAVQVTVRIPYTRDRPTAPLSERELEILRLLTQGHRDRDIADQLVISESTVKFHMNNVLGKLKARTRYQAIYIAILQGFL